MKRIYYFLLIFVLFGNQIFPQIKIHRTLTVEDGLVQSSILSFYQDSKGYLWIGTQGGLSSWDGIDFMNYSSFNGLANERVNAITEGKNGELFFGTSNGLSVYTNNKFKNFTTEHGLLANDIYSLFADDDGKIYIGTGRGINIIHNGRIDTLSVPSNLIGSSIRCISKGNNGELYFGTFLNGIFILKDNKYTNFQVKDGLAHNKVNDVLEDENNTLYIGTNTGLSIYRNNKFYNLNNNNGLPANYVSKIIKCYNGDIYISTFGGGVSIYKNGKIEIINKNNGLTNDFVNCMLKGADDMIYIGTNGSGVFLYRNDQFATYNEEVGLSNNIVMLVQEDHDGRIYFGFLNGGLNILENNRIIKLSNRNGLLSNFVRDVFVSREGDVYFCTTTGVQIYDPLSGYLKTLNALYRNDITTAYEEKDGTIYFGSSRGVYIYKNGSAKWDLGDNSILYTYVAKIIKGSDNKMYFGTVTNGLIVKDADKYHSYKEENGLANSILDFCERKDGSIAVATSKGLFILKENVIDTLNVIDGLSDNYIYSVLEGDKGELYATTNRGMNIINYSDKFDNVRIITHSDGLASDECNQSALLKDSKGRIWIGTVRGVTCYDPSKETPHSIPPNVHLTRIRLFEEDIPISDFHNKPTFRYNENYFKFDFIGINISSPQSVVYKYRMVGIDKDWLETPLRFVQYTNLNDGDFRFEIMARNEWGFWSEPAVLAFTISSPFWETWWFISLVILLISSTATFFILYRVRQLLAIERLRTKIAADLHDNIGSSLTEISILGEVLSHKLARGNTEIKKGLNVITETSRSLVDKMSDIVWLVNPRRDSLYDLILRLKDSYTELLYHKGISFKSNNLKSLEKISLSMEHRQNLYLIFKEAINNSLKHSNCSEITLDAAVKGKSLKMILTDNGEGFDTKQKPSGNGLSNMFNRAALIGGKLMINSSIGSGTNIQFTGNLT